MRHPHLLPLLAAAGAALSGCGDPPPAGDDTPDAGTIDPPTGPYTAPEDFPREGCSPGGFPGGHPQGLYHVRLIYGPNQSYATPIRIDENGGAALGGLMFGREPDVVFQYGDDDIILQMMEGTDVWAMDLCANDGGVITGTYVSCSEGQEPECWTVPLEGALIDPIDAVAENMTLLGEFGGDWPFDDYDAGLTVNVRVADGVAYVARYMDGLRIVDVSDPENMVELGHLAPEFGLDEIYNDVKIADGPTGRRYALMASSYTGVVVVDVTDPATPTIETHFGTGIPGGGINTHTLFVDGGRAYLATGGVGLEIWDIADPIAPTRLGTFSLAQGDSYLHDLYVSGDRAYLNFWDFGMAIVDVSNPADPELLGLFADYGETSSHSNWVTHIGNRDIAIHGDEQWGSHVHVVDVTEGTPAFATSIAEWETRPAVSVHNIMADGNLAIMAYYQDGIRVLDLSDPTAPVEVAHYNTFPGYSRSYGQSFFAGAVGLDLDVANRIVYVADSHRGLLVLRLDT